MPCATTSRPWSNGSGSATPTSIASSRCVGTPTDVRLLQSTRLERIKEGAERRADALARAGIDGINLNRRDWNGGLVVLFHRFGRVAFGWDMQFEHELRDGLRMGLDARVQRPRRRDDRRDESRDRIGLTRVG